MTEAEKRAAQVLLLSRIIPDFKEERLIDISTAIRMEHTPYDDPRYKDGFVTEADRTFPFVISDESVDSYGTVFLADGWDLSMREKGKRQVTYQHPWIGHPDPNVIIGLGYEEVKGKELLSRFVAEPYSTNTTADSVVNKLHYGTLTDASIRAYIVDGYAGEQERGQNPDVFYFSNSLLIDWGVVQKGSNDNAMVRSIDRCMDSLVGGKPKDEETLIAAQRNYINGLKSRRS